MQQGLKPLLLSALREPRVAARTVLDMRLPDQALWMALSLVAILTTLFVAGLLQIAPIPQNEFGQLLETTVLYRAPLVAALIQWGQAVFFVFVLHWVGVIFGGQGARRDVLAVMTLLQVASFSMLLVLTLVGMALPILSGFAMLIFVCWWIYAFVSFVDVAHDFNAPLKTAGVLIAAFIGFVIGTSLILSLVGGLILGVRGG